MAVLARSGFKTQQIMKMTGISLAFATANGLELADGADIIAKTMKQFGLEASDATRIADVLSNTARNSNVSVDMMRESFAQAAPIAKAYGLTLEQTAAFTGMLGNMGIQASQAGTTMKNMLVKIAAPSAKAAKMMQQMGIAVVNADGSMKGAGAILTELGPALGNLNKGDQLAVLNELFGKRGIAGGASLMAQAMKDGKNPIEAFNKILLKSNGVTKEMQKNMQRGAVGAFAKFNSAFEAMAISIANSGLLEFVVDVAKGLTDFFTAVSRTSPAMLKFGLAVAAFAAVAGPVIWIFGVFSTVFAALLPVLAFVKAAMIGIATVMAVITAPVWLIVAAVVALVAILARAFFAWDKLVGAFKSGKGFFGTIAKVGKTFFGFGGDDEKKKAGGALGPDVGAKKAVRNAATGSTSTTATNNAAVEITLKGDTKGVRTKTSGTAPLTLNTGLQGGLL